ncbi:class I SAM-dependent methyltransferase [Altererythrobacter sp.]|uniref:class I SAM-dependent methyltransferase n=1 Tax=Altererythrobacter sp. TaxID=1872480 RepID=UPI001B0AE04C|nr:class I SAM-dependent methyltransferase [Altererythrobacter sp.]MBO6609757.1 class I SAM-dependent methyltransferase [Altererythrobacter sp.]MBO6641041.1 class I SAM-dependent methyltransferase [Altererythrobacter sp.]MBO6708261.1 class I SAM-dependent methyltransferase [Altererythrobacter sp.]
MAELRRDPVLMVGEGWEGGYRLLDSGNGRKLERFGPHAFIRPEPQAMWNPRTTDWRAAGEFIPGSDEDGGGRWQLDQSLPEDGWPVSWNEVTFTAQPTPFRHLQFFPDMAPVWDWMREQLGGMTEAETMNLFGYTGVGSLALSRHGRVTHVDASKKSVAQARENAALSGMEDRPIRWLVDDAAKYTAREVRRGNRFDGIILDPPKFGRGPKNETWRLEESLPALLADCRQLLDADSKFLFLTVYAVRMSSLALAGLVDELFADLPGTIEHGDLAVQETGERGRLLPTAIFARWSNSG